MAAQEMIFLVVLPFAVTREVANYVQHCSDLKVANQFIKKKPIISVGK